MYNVSIWSILQATRKTSLRFIFQSFSELPWFHSVWGGCPVWWSHLNSCVSCVNKNPVFCFRFSDQNWFTLQNRHTNRCFVFSDQNCFTCFALQKGHKKSMFRFLRPELFYMFYPSKGFISKTDQTFGGLFGQTNQPFFHFQAKKPVGLCCQSQNFWGSNSTSSPMHILRPGATENAVFLGGVGFVGDVARTGFDWLGRVQDTHVLNRSKGVRWTRKAENKTTWYGPKWLWNDVFQSNLLKVCNQFFLEE